MTLYVRVTDDKYELPMAVADSVNELAEMTGTTANVIRSSMSKRRKTFIRVEVPDDNTENHF